MLYVTIIRRVGTAGKSVTRPLAGRHSGVGVMVLVEAAASSGERGLGYTYQLRFVREPVPMQVAAGKFGFDPWYFRGMLQAEAGQITLGFAFKRQDAERWKIAGLWRVHLVQGARQWDITLACSSKQTIDVRQSLLYPLEEATRQADSVPRATPAVSRSRGVVARLVHDEENRVRRAHAG